MAEAPDTTLPRPTTGGPGPTEARAPRVIVIGVGFGGLAAAKALARAPVDLTVIDRRNHHLFQPLLYQVATAALSPADIAVPIRSVLRAGRRPRLDVLLEVCSRGRQRVSAPAAVALSWPIMIAMGECSCCRS